MKIIVINNNVMVEKNDGKLYIHNSYAPFLEELASLHEDVLFYQFRLKCKNDMPLMDYCVNDRNYKVMALKRNHFKIVSYLRAYLCFLFVLPKYDTVYIFYPTNFHYLGFIAKMFGKKFGLYIRGQIGIDSKVSKWLYRIADISLTEPGLAKTVTDCGGKADTIRPMIKLSQKDVVIDRIYCPTKLKILFLGRIEFDKGLRELLQAIAKLRDDNNTNFHLDIVGDGNHVIELKQLCSMLSLEELVTFWGNQSGSLNIKRFFTQSDIYVLPSYHEGFPRTLYEAMAYGTPIITTFVGGIPYIMRANENCLEITPKSVDSIYETIKLVLRDYSKMIPIAKNGSKTFIDYLDTHKMTHAVQLTKYLNHAK